MEKHGDIRELATRIKNIDGLLIFMAFILGLAVLLSVIPGQTSINDWEPNSGWVFKALFSTSIALGLVAVALLKKKYTRLSNYAEAKLYFQTEELILGEARKLVEMNKKASESLSELDQTEEIVLGQKGYVVIQGQSTPGVEFAIYDRWISSAQGINAPLDGAQATYRDNTSKFATQDGSVTNSFTSGGFNSASYTPSFAQNRFTFSSGSLNSNTTSVTTNMVTFHDAGSATVHVTGAEINGYLTFSDPHFAAHVANTINQLGKFYPNWEKVQKDAKKELAALRKQLVSALTEIRATAVAIYPEGKEISNYTIRQVDALFAEAGISSKELR